MGVRLAHRNSKPHQRVSLGFCPSPSPPPLLLTARFRGRRLPHIRAASSVTDVIPVARAGVFPVAGQGWLRTELVRSVPRPLDLP